MITPKDIKNAKLKTGFRFVSEAGSPGPSGGGHGTPRWFASVGRTNHKAGRTFLGPRRATPLEAAQDYCDYANGKGVTLPAKLKTAGHVAPPRRSFDDDPEVQAALGVLRDARAQRRGVQGYVYLIVEELPGGALRYGKVGFSTNPHKRVAELQTGNPRVLRLHLARPGTEADEAALHAKYAHRNVLQEWFHITKNLLLEWDASHQVPNPAAQSGGQTERKVTSR